MNETFVALGVVTCLVCGLLSITLMFISITETIEYFEWHLVCTFIASIALICIFLIFGTGIYLLTTSKADLCPTCHHQYQTYATYKYCPICDAIVQKQIR